MYHNNSFLLDGFSTADQLGLFNVYINFRTFTSRIQQVIYSTPNKGTCTRGVLLQLPGGTQKDVGVGQLI